MMRRELDKQNNAMKELQSMSQGLQSRVNKLEDVKPIIDAFISLRVVLINTRTIC